MLVIETEELAVVVRDYVGVGVALLELVAVIVCVGVLPRVGGRVICFDVLLRDIQIRNAKMSGWKGNILGKVGFSAFKITCIDDGELFTLPVISADFVCFF